MHARLHYWGLIGACLLGIQADCEGPAIKGPVVPAFVGVPVAFSGTNFGPAAPESALLLEVGGGAVLRIESQSAAVSQWQNDRIEVTLPPEARSGLLRVVNQLGTSVPVSLELYQYSTFDIPPTPNTNAVPLAIAFDPAGRVWVNQEFHLDFQVLDIATGVVQGIPTPKPPGPGPFAAKTFGDNQTQISVLGEDIMLDPFGRVWFTQGGGFFYDGAFPNHSRVVSFDPSAPSGSAFRIYNVPGDRNEVIGVAWDPFRNRIWFTEAGLSDAPNLTSFDPEAIPFDNTFDFSSSLDEQVCAEGEPDDDCYHRYDLPGASAYPIYVAVDAEGFVWYSSSLGNRIGRLAPETGEVREFPLPAAIGQSTPAIFFGASPARLSFGANGDVYFNESFDMTLSRFDKSRVDDPACLALDASGQNPCITSLVIPGADLVNEGTHSSALDPEGRLWFTIMDSRETGNTATVGFVTPDFQSVALFPKMEVFPGNDRPNNAGIAVDPATGEIWFNEFHRKRIARLQRVP